MPCVAIFVCVCIVCVNVDKLIAQILSMTCTLTPSAMCAGTIWCAQGAFPKVTAECRRRTVQLRHC